MELSRRNILGGLIATLAAPAIVRATSLMPVRGIIMPVETFIGYHRRGVAATTWYIGVDGFYLITGDDEYGDRKMERIWYQEQSTEHLV